MSFIFQDEEELDPYEKKKLKKMKAMESEDEEEDGKKYMCICMSECVCVFTIKCINHVYPTMPKCIQVFHEDM